MILGCVLCLQGQPLEKGLVRFSTIHIAALMVPFVIVVMKVLTQIGLHFVDGFIPFCTVHDAEVFVQQGSVETLDRTVGLRPAYPGGAVLDTFHLQKQFVVTVFWAPAEFAPVAWEHGFDFGLVLRRKWAGHFRRSM